LRKLTKHNDKLKKDEKVWEKNASGYQNVAIDSVNGFISGDWDRRPKFIKGKVGNGLLVKGDCGIDFHKSLDFERNQPFSISLWFSSFKKGDSGSIYCSSNGEFEGFRGYRCLLLKDGTLQITFSYVYPSNCIDIVTTDKLTYNQWQNLILTYNGNSKASGIKIFRNGSEMKTNVVTDNLSKSMVHGENKSHWDAWTDMTLMMGKEIRRETMDNFAVDEFKIYTRLLAPIEIQGIAKNAEQISEILKTPRKDWTETQERALFDYYRLNFDPYFQAYSRNLKQLRGIETETVTDVKEVMSMSERKNPRKTFILNRGAYDALGEEVSYGVINKILPFENKFPRNRLGLAQWLLDEKNPLFARVTVNRFWQTYFGYGLSKTTDDFGNQGEMPSHPEL
jgi:Protein of unknown function (DUF1553)/Concanavalin A-like lectin/glucanases superfamily